jgi:hypothetical protein
LLHPTIEGEYEQSECGAKSLAARTNEKTSLESLTQTLKTRIYGEPGEPADTRTTQLYDRGADTASLDEYTKVGI